MMTSAMRSVFALTDVFGFGRVEGFGASVLRSSIDRSIHKQIMRLYQINEDASRQKMGWKRRTNNKKE